ncbi:hypothetical protein EGI16_19610 [Chryseobacterium sp. G0240]|uniref:hypothetical protein n=1 Tax=Chryseobacterium sp. G0240 TaxID=2487066 RepID=UPI000F45D7E6|nr:hypothetical protein [Chryseobacterium sp. G0240]ROH98777.1 hypothetical protein EGI16_19610 [Chryseobacterium sp. G0240]
MNTSKDNLEFQIKKQMENREVEPSRDLWSEIEFQTGNNNRPQSRMNRVLVAACLVLTFGLGATLFLIKEKNPAEAPEIVQKISKPASDKPDINPERQQKPFLAVQNNEYLSVKNIPSGEKKPDVRTLSIPEEKKIIADKGNIPMKKPEIIQVPNPKIIAQNDSLKGPVKKKKYVDPSTLLFSVEHKDVIEKTKDGSNVATIELNR